MRHVRRDEILDWQTYTDRREAFRTRVLAAKAVRRLHLGEHLTLLFENTLTVRYQIQEMVRAERLVREADIQHEIETYNEILGSDGELGCTLLVEIDDIARRERLLREWWELPERLYVRLADGRKVRATFDPRQRGDGKVSAVQFVKFPVAGSVPVAAGVDLPGLEHETAFDASLTQAIGDDLADRVDAAMS